MKLNGTMLNDLRKLGIVFNGNKPHENVTSKTHFMVLNNIFNSIMVKRGDKEAEKNVYETAKSVDGDMRDFKT